MMHGKGFNLHRSVDEVLHIAEKSLDANDVVLTFFCIQDRQIHNFQDRPRNQDRRRNKRRKNCGATKQKSNAPPNSVFLQQIDLGKSMG